MIALKFSKSTFLSIHRTHQLRVGPRRKIKILTLEKIRKLKIKGSSEKKKKEAPAQPCRRVNIEDEEKLTKGGKLLPKKLLFQFDKRKMNQQAENLYKFYK